MKHVKIIFFLSLFFFIGCSSTYTISDFSSKEKFYNDFNKCVKDKTLKITLDNDSSFTAFEGSKISNDSLIFISQIKKEEIKIKPAEIKYIKYFGADMSKISADILLKNGKIARAENVSLLSDSSICAVIVNNLYMSLPLNNIKKVSYKNHELTLLMGLVGGTLGGFITAYFVFNTLGVASNQKSDNTVFYGGLGITTLGLVGGGILGWIEGYTYTYQFNP